jgi:hypothetical protein
VTSDEKQTSVFVLIAIYLFFIVLNAVLNVLRPTMSWSEFCLVTGWGLGFITLILSYPLFKFTKTITWYWNNILFSNVRVFLFSELIGIIGWLVMLLIDFSKAIAIIGASAFGGFLIAIWAGILSMVKPLRGDH